MSDSYRRSQAKPEIQEIFASNVTHPWNGYFMTLGVIFLVDTAYGLFSRRKITSKHTQADRQTGKEFYYY
jgi:hypothetical protein